MNTVSVLRKMDDLLATEQTWTQGALARNDEGASTLCNSPDAVCWCLLGAMYRVGELANFDQEQHTIRVLSCASSGQGWPWFADLNDAPETTFADVKTCLQDAIRIAEKELL